LGGTGGVGVQFLGNGNFYGYGGNGDDGYNGYSPTLHPGANSGGGGPGGYADYGADGTVIITYSTKYPTGTGGTITTNGGNTVHTFTTSGIFSI